LDEAGATGEGCRRRAPAIRMRLRWSIRGVHARSKRERACQQTVSGQTLFREPWCPPKDVAAKDTGRGVSRPTIAAEMRKKKGHARRGLWEPSRHARCREKLLGGWRGWLRSRWPGGCRLAGRARSCRGGYARLGVIEIHHGLGDISLVAIPEQRALRPWV